MEMETKTMDSTNNKCEEQECVSLSHVCRIESYHYPDAGGPFCTSLGTHKDFAVWDSLVVASLYANESDVTHTQTNTNVPTLTHILLFYASSVMYNDQWSAAVHFKCRHNVLVVTCL